jgi:polysaccharide biosynthesis transport protein
MFEASRQLKPAVAGNGDFQGGFARPAALDLHQIWLEIWRGRATILITTAATLLVAMLIVLIMPQKYTAVTQILIDPTDFHAVANEIAPTSQVTDAALLQVESQVRVLTSDEVLRRVVAAEGLDHDPEFVRGQSAGRLLIDSLKALLGFRTRLASADPSLAALIELKRHLQVKRAERTYVVDIGVTSEDPAKAARIANAITQAYLTQQTQVRADAARQVSQSLTARLKELRERVREAEERVEAFKASNNIVGANGQLINEQQLSDLNNQLAAARAHTAEAKARLDQVVAVQKSKVDIGAFPEAVQSQTITALRSQYAEVVRRQAEQMSSLGPRHPAVIEIEAQAERLRRMIEDEVNRIAVSARTEYESAKASEEMLSRKVAESTTITMATNQALVTLRELQREVQASRTVYEAFLVRARETGEQERLDTKNIQIISRADPPPMRSWPPSNLLVALGAIFLGVAAGGGLVMLRAAPVSAAAGSRQTAIAPRALRRAGRVTSPSAEGIVDVPVLAVLPGVDVSFGLDAVGDPTSRFAAGIRKVYEAVRAGHKKRGNPSILIVAPDDGDDTAAVALTLAALAAVTQRVLLIDADVEQRTLSAIDADQSDAGLVDVAVGRRRLSDVVFRDRGTNVNLLPFVSPNSRRDRSITDEDLRGAFAQTRHFEMVIVAAMDISRNPSTRFFAHLVDHILVVTRADEVDDGAVDDFVSRLGLDARKVRGAVVTEAEAA